MSLKSSNVCLTISNSPEIHTDFDQASIFDIAIVLLLCPLMPTFNISGVSLSAKCGDFQRFTESQSNS